MAERVKVLQDIVASWEKGVLPYKIFAKLLIETIKMSIAEKAEGRPGFALENYRFFIKLGMSSESSVSSRTSAVSELAQNILRLAGSEGDAVLQTAIECILKRQTPRS